MTKNNFKVVNYSLYEVDENLNIIKIDKAFTKLTGYTKSDIKSLKLNQSNLIFEEDREAYFKFLEKNLSKKDELFLEHRIKNKDGKGLFVYCLGEKHYERNKIKYRIRIIDLNKSFFASFKQHELENKYNNKISKLVKQATIDSLTGLLRRETYEFKVNNYINNKVDFSFAMLDVDNFKHINDQYGHDVGDRILKNVARILKKETSDFGIVGRMGGDEFSICIIYLDEDAVKEIIEKIRVEVSNIKLPEDTNFKVTMSIGVNFIKSSDTNTFNDIYVDTDRLLYISKENGKNRVTY